MTKELKENSMNSINSADSHDLDTYDLDNHLPYRIAVISNLLQLNRDIEIKNLTSLGSREIRVLLNIGTFMPISSANIALQTKMDSYTISRGVKTLLDKQLIRKEALEGNRKEKLLLLTEEGQALYQKITPKLEARDQQFKDVLPKAQREKMINNLKMLEEKAIEILAEHALFEQSQNQELSADQKEIIRWYNKT